MTRVLLDTNVVLDFLLDRPPFAEAAAALWQANEDGRIEAAVQVVSAQAEELDALVTRDPADYDGADFSVLSPVVFVGQLPPT